jgi:DnaK suppressor protein
VSDVRGGVLGGSRRYGRGVPQSAPELDLRAIEQQLRSRLAETEDRIAELTKPPEADADIGFGKRIGEGTNEAISRFTEVGVANDLHTIEKRIERALEKLGEGTYGACDECGGKIAAGRLRAAPESARCIRCARMGARRSSASSST